MHHKCNSYLILATSFSQMLNLTFYLFFSFYLLRFFSFYYTIYFVFTNNNHPFYITKHYSSYQSLNNLSNTFKIEFNQNIFYIYYSNFLFLLLQYILSKDFLFIDLFIHPPPVSLYFIKKMNGRKE